MLTMVNSNYTPGGKFSHTVQSLLEVYILEYISVAVSSSLVIIQKGINMIYSPVANKSSRRHYATLQLLLSPSEEAISSLGYS